MRVSVRHIDGDVWEASLPARRAAIEGMPPVRPRRVVHAPDEAAAIEAGELVLAREYPAWRLGAGMGVAELAYVYLEHAQALGLYTPDTAHDYHLMVARYVEPHFAREADEACTEDFEALYAFLRAGGLSDKTLRKLNVVLRAAYGWMRREGIVVANPLADIRFGKAGQGRVRVFSEREAALLLAAIAEAIEDPSCDRKADCRRVMAFGAWTIWWTGARVGEVCALLRRGVSFGTGRLEFAGSVTERGHLRIKEPKTKAGRRWVGPGDEYMASLGAFLRWQGERWFDEGVVPGEDTTVLCRRDGGLIRPSDMSAAFKELAAAAGIELADGESCHVIRHTNITYTMAAGANPDAARRRYGHERIETTIGSYGHAMPGEDEAAASAYAAALRRIREGGAVV